MSHYALDEKTHQFGSIKNTDRYRSVKERSKHLEGRERGTIGERGGRVGERKRKRQCVNSDITKNTFHFHQSELP